MFADSKIVITVVLIAASAIWFSCVFLATPHRFVENLSKKSCINTPIITQFVWYYWNIFRFTRANVTAMNLNREKSRNQVSSEPVFTRYPEIAREVKLAKKVPILE